MINKSLFESIPELLYELYYMYFLSPVVTVIW